MPFELMTLRCSLRNLLRQKGRTGMTLASIVFGVVGLIVSGGFVEDIFIQLREATIHSRFGHLQIYKEGFYANGVKEPYDYLIAKPDAVKISVAAVPGVLDSMLRLNFSGLLNNGKSELPILGEGVEADKEAKLGSHLSLIAGRQLADNDANGMLIGEGVATSLGIGVGTFVTILANTPEGALNSLEFKVVGIFRTYAKDFDARAVRVSLAVAQELLGVEGAHAVVVSLDQTLSTDRVAATLRAGLSKSGFEVKTWFELDDFYANTVALYQTQLGVLQFIILVVVLLSVANSVNMTAYERVGEYGTLKALGSRNRQISLMIILENTLLGLIGASLGLILGTLLALVLSAIGLEMPPPPNSNVGYTAHIRLVPGVLLLSFAVGFFATVLSSLLPARGVARIPVVDALRQNI
ncbi:FtsX-like permease family protein [Propionivibrio sp.]|uniref:ABC transporter permease n=1 Tax=Propionivibrio sp. TaxID=2212460 RepID=UPI002617E1B1|nr:FtsX-like permease family protein [Propionivibrio sp.]